MLYLITGGMGAGKTLYTLRWVRDLQLATDRPVAIHQTYDKREGKMKPRITLKGEALTWGWKVIDFENWADEPDGTIFIIDECHEVMPTRGATARAPQPHIQDLAAHRHRGFDFFLITQHPKNMDSFVRRLIADPGWHRHIKRRRGADFASVLEWPNVTEKCESNTAGKTATVTSGRYPKEVFDWYTSASIHTAKFRFPKQLYFIIAAVVLVPVLIGGAIYYLKTVRGTGDAPAAKSSSLMPSMNLGSQQASGGQTGDKRPMTTAEYVDQFMPRMPGLAYTAPRYDELTNPMRAPYPAACMHSKKRDECKCFTQDATPLDVPAKLCLQIVKDGIFLDWQQPSSNRSQAMFDEPSGAPAVVHSPPAPVARHADQPMGYAERLAARNAAVSSVFGQ